MTTSRPDFRPKAIDELSLKQIHENLENGSIASEALLQNPTFRAIISFSSKTVADQITNTEQQLAVESQEDLEHQKNISAYAQSKFPEIPNINEEIEAGEICIAFEKDIREYSAKILEYRNSNKLNTFINKIKRLDPILDAITEHIASKIEIIKQEKPLLYAYINNRGAKAKDSNVRKAVLFILSNIYSIEFEKVLNIKLDNPKSLVSDVYSGLDNTYDFVKIERHIDKLINDFDSNGIDNLANRIVNHESDFFFYGSGYLKVQDTVLSFESAKKYKKFIDTNINSRHFLFPYQQTAHLDELDRISISDKIECQCPSILENIKAEFNEKVAKRNKKVLELEQKLKSIPSDALIRQVVYKDVLKSPQNKLVINPSNGLGEPFIDLNLYLNDSNDPELENNFRRIKFLILEKCRSIGDDAVDLRSMDFHKDDKQNILDFCQKIQDALYNVTTYNFSSQFPLKKEDPSVMNGFNNLISLLSTSHDYIPIDSIKTCKWPKFSWLNDNLYQDSKTALSDLLTQISNLINMLIDLKQKSVSGVLVFDEVLDTLSRNLDLSEEGSFTTYSKLIEYNLEMQLKYNQNRQSQKLEYGNKSKF